MFNWRTHETKTFDVIKLKFQPNTPEIQRKKEQPQVCLGRQNLYGYNTLLIWLKLRYKNR